MTEPLWCWCCATWGLSVAAIDATERLCGRCMDSSPSACKNRHMAEALKAGQQAEKQSGAIGHGHD